MSKETNYEGMSFRIRFVSANGLLMGYLEWTTDRDLVAHFTDTINHNQYGIRAFVETKGSGYVEPKKNSPL